MRKVFRTIGDFGPLRMRLQRFGHANCAFYKIVVAQARFRRNGRYHDILGTYYPHPSSLYNTQPTIASGDGNQSNTDSSDVVSRYKHVALDFEKAKYWLSVGAEPTSMVAKLFSKAGLLPSMPRRYEMFQNLNK